MAFRALRQLILDSVTRAIVRAVDGSKKFQELQIEGVGGALRSDVEHVENYGFSSRPLAGAEAVVVNVGGDTGHPVAVVVGDRRYRILNLESGEVVVYDQSGSKILLKASGDIEITPSSGTLALVGDLTVSGAVDVVGNITSDATITGDVVSDGGKILGTHTHPIDLSGGTTTQSCTAGGASGTTGGSVTSGAPS